MKQILVVFLIFLVDFFKFVSTDLHVRDTEKKCTTYKNFYWNRQVRYKKNILGTGHCLIFFHFIYVDPVILTNPGLIQ